MILATFIVLLYVAGFAVMTYGFNHALPESPEEEQLEQMRLARPARHY